VSVVDAVEWTAIGGLAIVAAARDVQTGRIPNALTLGAAAGGILVSAAQAGLAGLGASVLGFVVGLAAFFPIFAVGGMGAGDVKLLAAFGAWLGPVGAISTAISASLVGGVYALAIAIRSGYLREAVRNLTTLAAVWSAVGPSTIPGMTLENARGPRLAYAVPIGLGAVIVQWFGFT
jgi:prepilin peptidase CpaA